MIVAPSKLENYNFVQICRYAELLQCGTFDQFDNALEDADAWGSWAVKHALEIKGCLGKGEEDSCDGECIWDSHGFFSVDEYKVSWIDERIYLLKRKWSPTDHVVVRWRYVMTYRSCVSSSISTPVSELLLGSIVKKRRVEDDRMVSRIDGSFLSLIVSITKESHVIMTCVQHILLVNCAR